jgi:hypothetical protein
MTIKLRPFRQHRQLRLLIRFRWRMDYIKVGERQFSNVTNTLSPFMISYICSSSLSDSLYISQCCCTIAKRQFVPTTNFLFIALSRFYSSTKFSLSLSLFIFFFMNQQRGASIHICLCLCIFCCFFLGCETLFWDNFDRCGTKII